MRSTAAGEVESEVGQRAGPQFPLPLQITEYGIAGKPQRSTGEPREEDERQYPERAFFHRFIERFLVSRARNATLRRNRAGRPSYAAAARRAEVYNTQRNAKGGGRDINRA